MGRRKEKLPLELIPSEKPRKVTFRKRRSGLLKKARELSILCDVKVCTIVYEKKSNGKMHQPPSTYPENREDVKEIIEKFTGKSTKIKKVENLADFYAAQTMQVKKEIQKLRTKSYEEKYPTWDERLNQFSADQLVDVLKTLESKIEAAQQIRNKKIESQQTLPPMALFPINITSTSQMLPKPGNYGGLNSMAMMNESAWHYSDNKIQYPASTSAAAPNVASYGGNTMSVWDYYGMFSNPLLQQPFGVDHELRPMASVPLSVSYEQPPLSLSVQPSYMKCPMPQSVGSSSSGRQHQFAAASSQSQFGYVDDPSMYMMMYNENMSLGDLGSSWFAE